MFFLFSKLQEDHASTGEHGNTHVQSHGHLAHAEQVGSRAASNGSAAAGAGTAAGGAATGGTGVDGAGSSGGLLVDVAGGGQGSRAGSLGLGADDLGLAVEVASSGGLLLGVVVGVEDVVELGAVVAHAVGTVDSSGGVAVDTGADSGVVATDEVEDVTEVLGCET